MKKANIVVLMLCLLFSLIMPYTKPVNASVLERYGYTQLKNDNQRTAYNAILAGVSAVKSEISFKHSGSSSEAFADVNLANSMVTKDYPELFWYNGSYNVRTSGSTVTFKPGEYTVASQPITSLDDLKPYKNQLDQAVSRALSKIKGHFSDYEIAHTFHDYMVQNVDYKLEGDHQTAYGALVGENAVCAGYARAYQLLLNRAGIPSFYVSGKSYAPNGQLIDHAWNLVWLDGKCYYSDTTWDDQSGDLFHEYLNLSKEEISKTHFTDDPLPPSCGHDDYTFFVKNDTKDGVCDFHGHKTIKEIAGCFDLRSMNGDIATYYCTIHYHGDNFSIWFEHVKEELITELGFSGTVQCNIIELGLEHHVTLSGKGGKQNPPATKPPVQQDPQPTQGAPAVTPPADQGGNTQQQEQQKPTQPVTTPPTGAPIQDATESVTTGATDPANPETGTSANTPTAPEASDSNTEEAGNDDMVMYIVYGSVLVAAVAGGFLFFRRLKLK